MSFIMNWLLYYYLYTFQFLNRKEQFQRTKSIPLVKALLYHHLIKKEIEDDLPFYDFYFYSTKRTT